MTVRFDLQYIEKHFSKADSQIIRDLFATSVTQVRVFLPIENIDVEVTIEPGWVKPEWGLIACTSGPNLIKVGFDPHYPRYKDSEGQIRFFATMAHEFHHAIRWRGTDWKMTLGERLVAEGLATNFEEQVGCPVFPEYYAAPEQIYNLTKLALPLLGSQAGGFDHPNLGQGEEFPHNRVHILGRSLVKQFLSVAARTAADSVHTPAQEILKSWLSEPLTSPRN